MINCEKVWVMSIYFERKADAPSGESEIPVGVDVNYASNRDAAEKNAKLELSLIVGDKGNDDFPFFFSLKLAGIFSWEELTSEEAESEISSVGAEQLMSFARTYLYDTMYKAGMNGIVLPLERFW